MVSLCTSLAAVSPLSDAALGVLHIQVRPLSTFNSMLSVLVKHSFSTKSCEYLVWCCKLEQHVRKLRTTLCSRSYTSCQRLTNEYQGIGIE